MRKQNTLNSAVHINVIYLILMRQWHFKEIVFLSVQVSDSTLISVSLRIISDTALNCLLFLPYTL